MKVLLCTKVTDHPVRARVECFSYQVYWIRASFVRGGGKGRIMEVKGRTLYQTWWSEIPTLKRQGGPLFFHAIIPSVAKVLLPLIFKTFNLKTERDTAKYHEMNSIDICSIYQPCRMLFGSISFGLQVREVSKLWQGAILLPLIVTFHPKKSTVVYSSCPLLIHYILIMIATM